jgi:hypothetical protein
LRCCIPLNSVLPAKSLFVRNVCVSRKPEECVQYALHENHASWPLGRNGSSWDFSGSRSTVACGARANYPSEFDQSAGGGCQDPHGNCANAAASAAAHRAAQGGADRVAKNVFRAERGSVHGGGARYAAIRIHVAALRRERSSRAAVLAATSAGLLRFGSLVCYGHKLSGLENGAVGALAQNLVGAASCLDGGEPGGIWIYASASGAALTSCVGASA